MGITEEGYNRYTHVVRLNEDATKNLLDEDTIYVTAKVDGTNCSAWSEDGVFHAGSRNHEFMSADDPNDNAGFGKWVFTSNDDEAVALRRFCIEHPEYHVYGEWTGAKRFCGNIKDYNADALGRFIIFDVWSPETGEYMPEPEWRELMSHDSVLADNFVELLATLHKPTYEEVLAIAEKNYFLLDADDPNCEPGEGVVLKSPTHRNYAGELVYGKLVLADAKQRKRAHRKNKNVSDPDVHEEIVEWYLTDAEMDKAAAKAVDKFGAEEFDVNHKGMMGFYLNECFRGAILEECPNFVKKFKNPTIDFAKLKNMAETVAKEHVGA